MNNIMLDLETMGTSADAAIIAVGAVRFDTEVTDRFYKVVDLQSSVDAGLTISASTVMWWMQQSDEARAKFKAPGEPLTDVLLSFSEWVGEDADMWGNGADFDNTILSTAYRLTDIQQPWKFWRNKCYRTIKGLYPNIKLERTGIYHCAVDDAESQANHLIKILAVMKQP